MTAEAVVDSPGFEVDAVTGRPLRRIDNWRDLTMLFGDLDAAVVDPEITLGGKRDSYSKCIQAMWRFGLAAFELIAQELGGVSSVMEQAALLQLIAVHREGPKAPVLIISGDDALHPQTDPYDKLTSFLADIKPWLQEQAAKRIEEMRSLPDIAWEENGEVHRSSPASPTVLKHWQFLIDGAKDDAKQDA